MSSVPNGGVSIDFAPNRSSVDAYLGELRRGVTVPVNFQPTGTPGAPGLSTSASPATPSTFGNIGQQGTGAFTIAGSAPLSSLVGPGTYGIAALNRPPGSPFVAPANSGLIGPGSTGIASLGGGGASAGSFERATQALTAAAQQISQAAQTIGGRSGGQATPEGDEGGGGVGGGNNRFLGLSTRGLARYVGAGFLLREGLSVAQGYQNYQIQGQLDAARGDPLANATREMGLAKAITGIPIVGQVADLATGGASSDAQLAILGAEEGRKDALSATKRYGEDVRSRARVSGIDRRADSFGRIGYERRAQSIVDSLDDASGAFVAEQKARIQDIVETGQFDPREAWRMHHELGQYQRSGLAELQAKGRLADAQQQDLLRQRNLEASAINRRAPELQAAGRGEFGRAGEASFERGLEDSAAQADEKGGGLGGLQRNINQLSRAAHAGEIRFAIEQTNTETAITEALTNRRPLESRIGSNDRAREIALANARTPVESEAIRGRFDAEDAQTRQGFSDRADVRGYEVGARNESLRLGLSAASPGLGAALARSNNTARGGELSAYGVYLDDSISEDRKGGLAKSELANARLQLLSQRRDFLGGLQPEELQSINQQATNGPGTADGQRLLDSIDSKLEQITNLMQKGQADLKAALDEFSRDN